VYLIRLPSGGSQALPHSYELHSPACPFGRPLCDPPPISRPRSSGPGAGAGSGDDSRPAACVCSLHTLPPCPLTVNSDVSHRWSFHPGAGLLELCDVGCDCPETLARVRYALGTCARHRHLNRCWAGTPAAAPAAPPTPAMGSTCVLLLRPAGPPLTRGARPATRGGRELPRAGSASSALSDVAVASSHGTTSSRCVATAPGDTSHRCLVSRRCLVSSVLLLAVLLHRLVGPVRLGQVLSRARGARSSRPLTGSGPGVIRPRGLCGRGP
jgi:hypothetical protein